MPGARLGTGHFGSVEVADGGKMYHGRPGKDNGGLC